MFADEPAPVASAEPSPEARLAWYTGCVLAAIVVLFGGLRLDAVSLKAPLSYGGSGSLDSLFGTGELMPDVLLILPLVKATLERGSHWQNERLGAPGIQELYDFPIIDHVHFALIWLMGQVDVYAACSVLVLFAAPVLPTLARKYRPKWRLNLRRSFPLCSGIAAVLYLMIHLINGASARYWNYVEVFNLYYLATYPLTALTAMYAFRRLGLSLPMAGAGGLLYAFLPYHFLRGEAHYFLSAYWVIPLSWLPAFALCRGEFPFFRIEPGGTYRLALWSRAAGFQVLLAAATASAGAYYAFFACAIYAFTGLYEAMMQRTVKAFASAILLVGFVTFFGIVNHIPAITYSLKNGRNTVIDRMPEEAERYGLKFAQLVLPVDGHNWLPFARLKATYSSIDRPIQNENTCATLGMIGTAGFLILMVRLLLPRRRTWPLGPLAVIAWFLFAFGTVGGLSSVFNLVIFDQIRCPNRISIYLAFLCLFAILWPLDRFLETRTGRVKQVRIPIIFGIALFGLWDQTPGPWFSNHIAAVENYDADRFRADHRFFSRIEELMPEGARIFNMPYMRYPEEPPLHDMTAYEHVRGYLHTNTLCWSFGAVKHREADAWNEDVYHGARDQILRRLVVRGFDGIYVDKRGFMRSDRDHGEILITDLKSQAESNGVVKLNRINHPDGRQVFLDIRPYRAWLQAQEPVRFEEWSREEREWVSLTWIKGTLSPESYGLENLHRWLFKSSTAMIVNPSDRTRVFRFQAMVGMDFSGTMPIHVRSETVKWLTPEGPVPLADDFLLEKNEGDWNPPKRRLGVQKEYMLEVPPGRHFVKWWCDLPPEFLPGDSRPICYYLRDIRFGEVK
jgi:hypothetical protein